ncbi:unnamed protein product [Callosobruchus maculatus]|uniref:Uncharacterized protein n=1 Tax=Callosobruchus maculatus TaxID=64391 RepID=A0A653D1V8_CALMS|nr:unnamed protein product [Callosobruchus maculatus]
MQLTRKQRDCSASVRSGC